MNITTMSSRSFNQNVSKAKRAASKGPVFIIDRGHLSHALLTIEPVRLSHKLYRHTDLSYESMGRELNFLSHPIT